MKAVKPVLPSLREKKRYIAFEIISESKIKDFSLVKKALWSNLISFSGELGCAKAGYIIMPGLYNNEIQKGIIKTSHKFVEQTKAALIMINNIEGNKAIIKSIAVSGILNKVKAKIAK